MGTKTKKISATINEDVVDGLDEMAIDKDISRSKLISRYCKAGLESEPSYKYNKIISKAKKNGNRKR